jgi:hypothetical protein
VKEARFTANAQLVQKNCRVLGQLQNPASAAQSVMVRSPAELEAPLQDICTPNFLLLNLLFLNSESNEIVNVTATGTFLCVRNGDYLVYENLHGGTVEILLRLPEEDMLWKHTWKMGTNTAEVSTTELKLWEFKRLHSAENYRLLGVSRPSKSTHFKLPLID